MLESWLVVNRFAKEGREVPKALMKVNDQLAFDMDIRTAAEAAVPTSDPIMVAFDIGPLLDRAPADLEKLDQLPGWLAEQEQRVPHLRSSYQPPAAGRE